MKAVGDACMQIALLTATGESRVTEAVPYRLLEGFVHSKLVDAEEYRKCIGYQFAVILDPGYDDDDEIEPLFTSGLITAEAGV